MTMLSCTATTQTPTKGMRFDSDSYPIMIDNCASSSITNSLTDFVSPPKPSNKSIRGISGNTTALQVGTVKWRIEDDQGRSHTLELPNTYYAPSAPCRLLSPQHWSQVANDHKPQPHGTWCATYDDSMELWWDQQRYKRTVKLNPKTNVGIMYSSPGYEGYAHSCCLMDDIAEPLCFHSTIALAPENHTEQGAPTDEPTINPRDAPLFTDFNLDGNASLPEALHPTFEGAQEELLHWHYRLNHLSFRRIQALAEQALLPKRLAKARIPLCSGCVYGKATRKPWRTKDALKGLQKASITKPGDCVSVDQLESTTPGLIAQLKGIPTKARYRAATIFVDHYSGLSYVHLQTSLSSEDTVRAKKAFEAYAETFGVIIRHYHADNGRFQDRAFRDAIEQAHQSLSFCGVNAHFQNGLAEKRIRDLQDNARTMLLHAQRRWPQAISTHLWPYALRMANDVHNNTLQSNGKASPIEHFSQVQVHPTLRHFHHFGCPVYVLHNQLQAGQKGRKWDDRARIGIYLGPSPQHARSVALVLSLSTGLVSPQFHCSFDDLFETTTTKNQPYLPLSMWQQKTYFVEGPTGPEEPLPPLPTPASSVRPESQQTAPSPIAPEAPSEEPTSDPVIPQLPASEEVPSQPIVNLRRSTRVRKAPDMSDYVVYEALAVEPSPTELHPLAYKATADPDTMYLHEALREPDRKQFLTAMDEEIKAHEQGGHWEIVKRADIPKGVPILPGVWSMKRKRRIATQEIYKWKARLTIDGSKQRYGIHYWETYAPVVTWSSIRLFLIVSLLKGWHTRQLDFVLAYTQADVETDLYMEIPKGFQVTGDVDRKAYALKLIKNLYGQKQAGRVWNQHLTKQLLSLGFIQSKVDECVFYYQQSIFLVFTDDTILLGPEPTE